MIKPSLSILYAVVLTGFLCAGCSPLREAVMGRENPLARLDHASLGHTTRAEILQKFGDPDEINERRFDTHSAEVFYYYEQAESEDSRDGYPGLNILACEFKAGVLTGYLFQKLRQSGAESFDNSGHGKLVKGKTTRRETEEILGAPNGKSLLPTSLNLPALADQVGGVPAVFTATPENAREIWLYHAQSFDGGYRRPMQQSLIVFFDDKGTYLESAGLRQLVTKLP